MFKVYNSSISCTTCNKKITTKLQYHWHSVRRHIIDEKIVTNNYSNKNISKPYKAECTKHFCFCGKCNVEEVLKT